MITYTHPNCRQFAYKNLVAKQWPTKYTEGEHIPTAQVLQP